MPNTYATAFTKDFQFSKSQLSEVDAVNNLKFERPVDSGLGFPVSPGFSQNSQIRFPVNVKAGQQATNMPQDMSNSVLQKTDFGQRVYNTPLTQQRHKRRPMTTKMNHSQI